MVKFLKSWWLPALIICLPLDRIPSLAVHLGSHSATLHLSMLVAAVGICLFGVDILRRTRISFTSPYFWMAIYLIVAVLSVLVSIDKTRSLIALIATVLTVSGGVIVAQIVTLADLPRFRRYLFGITIAVSIFGLYQFIGNSFGLSGTVTGLLPRYTSHVFGFPRVQATELEPLFLANYLLFPILLTVSLLLSRLSQTKAMVGQLFLLGIVMSLTLSRGGLVGGLVGLAVAAVLLYRSISLVSVAIVAATIVLSAAVAIGAIYVATGIAHHSTHKAGKAVSRYVAQSTSLSISAASSDSDRVVDRRLALEEFRAHPVLGGGLGSFGSYAKEIDPAAYPASGNSPTVNDEYFEILAETGLLGALALAGLVITLMLRLYHAWRRGLAPVQRTWLVALTATGVAYAIQYYAFSTLYIPHIWVTIGLIVALTAPLPTRAPRRGTTSRQSVA
jgi:O-antigen ligase